MLFILIALGAVGGILATTPIEPPVKVPLSTDPQCPDNERWVNCVLGFCSPKTCSELGYPVACPGIIGPCEGGCVCIESYLRDINGICVPQKDCPSCRGDFNATSGCGNNCGNLCTNYNKPNNCSTLPLYCQFNGCDCKEGYVYDSVSERCVDPIDCPINQPCSDPNADRVECAPACRPTCAKPNPGPCILRCKLNDCVCKKEFILSAAGTCIPVDQCPKDAPCNGDSNAVIKAKPIPCPSTCDSPNASPYCKKYALEVGCECKPGFIKSSDDFDGKCIEPNTCPGGNPCGQNASFVNCNIKCPASDCPVTDKRGIIGCSPPYYCPSGCACKLNYRRKSSTDPRCILASDCPPVNCTRINEVWSPCPTPCLAEDCADINKQPTTCNTLIALNCQPKCICKKGHYRNNNGTCVPANQCPNQSCIDPNAERKKCAPAPSCRATCAVPNPGPCIQSSAGNECVCKKGYILSKKGGKCVPIEQCSTQTSCNGDVNAVVKACPLPCPSTCDAPNAMPCRKACQPVGCECKPGYILSKTSGKCIRPDKCPAKPIKCKKNEVYNPCRIKCPPQTCASPYTTYDCSKVNTECEPGCNCISEYLRNGTETDMCIPSELCPAPTPICGLNEHYEINSNKCDVTCKNKDLQAQVGPCPTSSGCFCDDGLVRNNRGICVKPKQCPKPIICPANEVLSECYNSCLITCRTRIRGDGRACNTACLESGCVCKPDFMRHDNGTCVPISECSPPQCNENETYSRCGTACPPTCENRGENCTSCTKQCAEDCFCSKGYVRADDGTCVRPKDCPLRTCTDVNEVFVECPPSCPATDGCSLLWSKFNCTGAVRCCKPQCRCKPGLYRGPSGECITAKQCTPQPVCHQKNEEYQDCGSSCPDTCENYKDTNRICTLNCVPGCNCKASFVRNLVDKTCVKPEHCPRPACKQNEIFQECGTACPLTCDNYKNASQVCTLQCVSDCFCAKGYVRDRHMRCVKPEDCEPKCPAGEKFSQCSAHCQSTCENYDQPNRICTLQCQSGCVCEEGTVRRKDGMCVPPLECKPQPTCSDTEIYSPCSAHCEPTCENSSPNRPCSRICKPGCKCKDGLFRQNDGQCVEIEECTAPQPVCLQENEVYQECGSSCPDTCDNYKDTDRICTANCVPACNCKPGYVRNLVDNTCVKPEQCPAAPQPVCLQENEVYQECGSSCPDTCDNYKDTDRICTANCVPACNCKPGLVRNLVDNTCVKPEQCPAAPQPVCLQENEVYQECGSSCPDTCDNYKDTDRICTANCVSACNCKPGYVRNLVDNTCVKPEQCPAPQPVCLQENEVYQECGSSCPDTCDNYKDTDRICTANCVPACNCKPGLVRNLVDNTCVKPEQCPAAPQPVCLQENEVYQECGSSCPDTCDNYKDTDRICTANCVPACNCKPGLVRNLVDNTCVKPEQCPAPQPVCLQENEVYQECGSSCPDTCDNYKDTDRICTANCVPACNCKPGFVRNLVDNTCVKPEQCQPKCPAGEKFSQCSAHCQNTCENYDQPDRICTDQCQPGCICEEGTVRRKDGTCGSPLECEPQPTCSDTEIYSPCSAHCEPTCENSSPNRPCSRICQPGCKCKDGLIRRNDGKCVKIEECSKPTCSGDEVYDPCSAHCEDTCENHGSVRPCAAICTPGCRCGEGLLRRKDRQCVKLKDCAGTPNNTKCLDPNAMTKECAPNEACRPTCAQPNPGACPENCVVNGCECPSGLVLSEWGGRCIKIEDCPLNNSTCNGDPNAVIKANPLACPSTCDAPNAAPFCKKLGPAVGCQCKPGYLLSKDGGKCILPNQCPGGNPCGVNTDFAYCKVECPNNKCPVDDSRGIIACDPPYPCPSGCVCKLNHRRSVDGKCILASDCPPVNCTRQNEVWAPCPSECLQENCADVNNQPTTCNTLVLNCQPRCICKKGHFRNDQDLCVPASQCPNQSCGDPNAERVECAPAPSCRATCAVPNPGPCIQSCAVNECVCKKGYILSEKGGKCVPIKQCPAKPIKCKKNEVYNPCRIKCPPQTCASPYTSWDCSKVNTECEPGCDCISEYLRNGTETDPCIPSELCPPPTNTNCPDPNALTKECAPNEACRPTCAQRTPGPCPRNCVVNGCECPPGLILSEKGGRCIKIEDCPQNQSCDDPNAMRVQCAPAPSCQATCAVPKPGPCTLSCRVNGCVCKKGYILSKKGGKCVPIKQCPTAPHACGINEVSTDCYNDCQRTCKNRIIGDDKVCTLACTRTGCVCKPDHFKHDNGTCVPENECSPPDCPKGEVYTDCGSACPTTCETRGDTCKACIAVCVKGCFCAGHTIRAPNGTCVEPKHCPKPICGLNEVFDPCPPTCPPTENCSNIWSKFDCSNAIDCCKPSCRCKPGFYKKSGKCISAQACMNGNGARAGVGYVSAHAEAEDSTA